MRSLPVLFSALAALFIYLPSVSFNRTLDDIVHVPSPDQKTLDPWSGAWTQPYWHGQHAGGGLYRPVTSSTFWLESKLGMPLWARHFLNVSLHAAITGLVVGLALRVGFGPGMSLVTGLMFAAHPTHVEAVAGLVGRAELLAALWILIALHLHLNRIRHPERNPMSSFLAFTAIAFLAAGSKESAWPLAIMALPLHATEKASLTRALPAFAGYAAGLGGHFLLRHHALGGWINVPHQLIAPVDNPLVLLHGWSRVEGGIRVAGVFLGHLLLPLRLSPDYSGDTLLSGNPFPLSLLGGSLLLLGLPALLIIGWKHRNTAFGFACLAAGTWIGLALLLTMNVFMNIGTIMADRLLFWPSAGWSLLAGAMLFTLNPIASSSRRWMVSGPLSLCLIGAYAFVTISYLPVWKNNLALFEYARRTMPNSPRVWSGYGKSLEEAGRYDDALEALHHSQKLAPGFQLPWAQEAALLIERGRFQEAKAPLAEALRRNPEDIGSQVNQTIIWLHEGNFKDARSKLEEILARNPRHALARKYLAMAMDNEGSPEEAAEAWKSYLALAPNDADALNSLARAMALQSGGARDAERLARQAIALDDRKPDYFDTLAQALYQQDKVAEAANAWRECLRRAPENDSALNDLAWILATQLDRAAEAETLAMHAVRIAPDNPNYRDTLAETLSRQGKTKEASQVAREGLELKNAPASLRRFLSGG